MSKIVFGGKDLSLEKFREENSKTNIFGVKQVHGDAIVTYSPELKTEAIEADSIIAKKNSVCIYVKTADCIPILIETKNYNAAIHAGWRGVVNGIAILTCLKLFQLGEKASEFNVSIGPHIYQDSFAVDLDVKDKIVKSISSNNSVISNFLNRSLVWNNLEESSLVYQKTSKFYVDLKKIVVQQLFQLEIKSVNDLSVDTVKDLNYNSYRRDGSLAGRNFNFIF